MLSKSQHRAKSAFRRPMSDVSNDGYDRRARFLKKEAIQTVESKDSLDRLLVVRSDLSDLISQIDKLVAQAIKRKEISEKENQEIEYFVGFLSGMCSSLKPRLARLQEALKSTSKDQIRTHATPFPLKTKLNSKTDSSKPDLMIPQSFPNTSLVTSKKDLEHRKPCTPIDGGISMQLDLGVSPSPLVSWRADPCADIDGGKQLFLLTPMQKSQIEVSKSVLQTKPLTNVRDTGFCRTSKTVLRTKALTILPETNTIKTHERHGKDGVPATESMCKLRFSGTSKTVLPNKPLPNLAGTDTSENCIKNGVPITEPIHDLKIIDRKRDTSGMLDWFFSPPKTCVLMEASDEKKLEKLSTPIDKNNNRNEECWNNLYMSATCTKKGEATLKRELWTRFELISSSDLRLNSDIFQKKDGKEFLDLLDEASS